MNWKNINLDSPYERAQNILDPYNSETLLLEINCNLRDITEEEVTKQFNESLRVKVETAKQIFKDNLQNILKAAIAERNKP